MTPSTLILLIVACIRGGHISPLQVTCTPLVDWEGGPNVYRITLKNTSRSGVVVLYGSGQGHLSIHSLEGTVPAFRELIVEPRWYNGRDEQPTPEFVLLKPGQSIDDAVPIHRIWRGHPLKFPAKLSAVWRVTYSLEPVARPKTWCYARVGCPFTARPVKPTAAEIDRFLRNEPVIRWMEYTDKMQFLPELVRQMEIGDPYAAAQAMCSIVEVAKESTDTIPKSFLRGPSLRGSHLFVAWQGTTPIWPKPSKAMIAELSRAPNEWVRLLAWATFPNEVPDAPTSLKKVPDLMCPEPTPTILALVNQLDDPAFKVREEASQKLQRESMYTVDVDAMLSQLLSQPGTAEQRQRLQRILATPPKVTSTAQRVVRTVWMIDTPRASQLLELLATGPPELRATEDAKKMRAERKEIERLQKAIDELERADKRLQKAIDRLERANKKD